ncbi:N/A [soil metagenome]
MCYRIVNGTLIFAERADTLASVSSSIDPQAIFDYLYFHAIPSPRTIFKDVFRVPPGHCVVFESGKATVAPYWKPTFSETRQPSFDKLAAEFRELLADAVRTQVESADGAPVGSFLSGGTDSSTIAGLLGKATGKPAETYSIGFDAQGYDEMEFARIASRHFGTRHHEYYVTPADLVRSIPEVATHFDQPFGNSSTLPSYYCAKRAREDGLHTMLGGDGGDELFGGNSRYAKQRVFGWYDHIPALLRKNILEPALGLPGMNRLALARKGSSYVEQARTPLPDRSEAYNLILRLGTADVLTADFLERVDVSAPLQQQRQVWQSAQTEAPVNQMLAFDWRYTLAENDLPKVLGATQLAGIAVGFPFLDQRLVDFSMRLPAEYKLKGLKLRWFFKEALRGFLPDEIITKKKQGFGLPFGVWADKDAALRKLASDSFESLKTRNIVRGEFLDRLMRDLLPQHPGFYGEMVWILMMLEQWLQHHAPEFKV